MLQLPKLTGYIGASVAKAVHLWVADAFVGNVWLVVLVLTALRFCRMQWRLTGWRAFIFATMAAAPTFFINVFVGQSVDYSVYAAIVVTMFAFADWYRGGDGGDAMLMVMASALAAATKPIAAFSALAIWLMLLVLAVRRRRFSYVLMAVASVAVTIILLASPMFTSWLSGREFVGLTNDFVCNEDGARMGYIARICYGWLSKDLAIAGCKAWYGLKDFNPHFEMQVAGRIGLFNILIWVSALAVLCSRKRVTTFVYLILVISSVALPLKYIGYPRYVPQVWLIPFLGFYIFAFDTDFRVRKSLRTMIPILVLIYVSPFLLRMGLQYARYATLERMRRASLAELSDNGNEYHIVNGQRYWLHYELARHAGVNIGTNQNSTAVSVGEEDLIYYPGFRNIKDTVLPQFNGISDIRNTDWSEYLKTLKDFPGPLGW